MTRKTKKWKSGNEKMRCLSLRQTGPWDLLIVRDLPRYFRPPGCRPGSPRRENKPKTRNLLWLPRAQRTQKEEPFPHQKKNTTENERWKRKRSRIAARKTKTTLAMDGGCCKIFKEIQKNLSAAWSGCGEIMLPKDSLSPLCKERNSCWPPLLFPFFFPFLSSSPSPSPSPSSFSFVFLFVEACQRRIPLLVCTLLSTLSHRWFPQATFESGTGARNKDSLSFNNNET
mmetsp:Transcript_6060/g.14751  ORF Transcript_6060/g.14751 Transcript_6060/m.14751 type:complete len:228 (-) Transcript_6060:760-1443(-)